MKATVNVTIELKAWNRLLLLVAALAPKRWVTLQLNNAQVEISHNRREEV